jgi:hypothetical protein
MCDVHPCPSNNYMSKVTRYGISNTFRLSPFLFLAKPKLYWGYRYQINHTQIHPHINDITIASVSASNNFSGDIHDSAHTAHTNINSNGEYYLNIIPKRIHSTYINSHRARIHFTYILLISLVFFYETITAQPQRKQVVSSISSLVRKTM